MATCRFCSEHVGGRGTSRDGVKYGVRHYAHFQCYLTAGKLLEALHPWQVGCFPYRLLKDLGLLGLAEHIRLEDPKHG